jgi:WD40 repeat protein
VAFHPDGRKLALTQPKAVELRELNGGTVVASWPQDREVRALAWRGDGKMLAVASGFAISLYAEEANRPLAILRGHEGIVTEVAFSHGGQLLASKAHDGTVRLWDVGAQRQLVRAPCVYTGCSPLQFSPDDRRLGFGSDGARLWTWDVAAGHECRTLFARTVGNWQSFMANFSPDGRLLAVGETSGLLLFDVETGRQIAAQPLPECWSVLFGADGRQLYTTSKKGLHRWPIAFDEPTRAWRVGPAEALLETGPLHHACLAGDGRTLAARRDVNSAVIVDVDNPRAAKVLRDHGQLHFVAVSPDGQTAATGTWYGFGVRLWRTDTGERLRDLPVMGSARVEFSPDGNWLTVATEREFQFWDTRECRQRHTVGKQPEIGPGGVAFAGDGAFAAVRHSTTQIRLVDPGSGRQLAEFQPPDQRTLLWHCLSPDGRWLAAASPGGAIHLWDLQLIRRQLAERGLDW